MEKAEIWLYPSEKIQKTNPANPLQKENLEGTVVVDGHSFPSIAAAVNATGYTAEQLKKYLHNSSDSNAPNTSKLQIAS